MVSDTDTLQDLIAENIKLAGHVTELSIRVETLATENKQLRDELSKTKKSARRRSQPGISGK